MKLIKDKIRITNRTGYVTTVQLIQNNCVVFEGYLVDGSGLELENIFNNDCELDISCSLQQENCEFFIDKKSLDRRCNDISVYKKAYRRGHIAQLKTRTNGDKNSLNLSNESNDIAIFRLHKSMSEYVAKIIIAPNQTKHFCLCSDFHVQIVVNGITIIKELSRSQYHELILRKETHLGCPRFLIEKQ